MDAPILHHNRYFLYLQERQGHDAPLLVKEPAAERPTRAIIAELHNEYAITAQLVDVPGVRSAYAKEGLESHPILLLEYIKGRALAELISTTQIALIEKLRLAGEIAGTLAQIHDHQIMHRDVSSSNILVAEERVRNGQDGLFFIDFGSAAMLRQESQQRIVTSDVLPETLAYISPEQTGRMNRLVDYRTDLYSLGVTLYELFTGALPFLAGDALGMIHCHMAHQPTPPHEIDANIPIPVSQIILKLLAKNAEDRYQTARGLQADLIQCLHQMQTTAQVGPFEIGGVDFAGHLLIPQKLYGRQSEIDQLLTTFERVVQGKAELLLVAGNAGVGKTSLVHEVQKPLTGKQGLFIEGKFDQFTRGIPYSAWVQAFSELVNNWLADGKSSLDRRRATILDAVGRNGQVLIDLIPALELVIGPQPDAPEVGGNQADNRLNYLFRRFVRAIATPERSLIIFLDDGQWIDSASLNLLKALLTDRDLRHLLVVLAYRDNGVDPTHRLMLGIDDLKETGVSVNQFTLSELPIEGISHLLSDSLYRSRDQCLPLAHLLQSKTGGNPFFTRQFLYSLEDEGLLWFDNERASWQWEMAELTQLAVSESIIDLLVNRLHRLPAVSLGALKIAACIGNQFGVKLLNAVADLSPEAMQSALEPAFQEGLIIASGGTALFAHDRIQQALYSLFTDLEKVSTHWRIGRILLEKRPQTVRDERLFDIVRHLNIGAGMIESEADRVELAELNMQAAQNALRANAYASALAYAKSGIGLLAQDGWQAHYRLTLQLHQRAAEAAYLHMDLDESERAISIILAEARLLVERVPAYITQIRVHNARNEMEAVMDIGVAILNELDFPLVDAPPPNMSVERVSNLPPMTEAHALAAVDLLGNLMLTAYVARPDLFTKVVYTSMHITLEFGLHPAVPLTISTVGVLAWGQDIDEANRWGQLALQLVDRLEAYGQLAQVKTVYDGFILPWKKSYRHVEGEVISDIQLGLEAGGKIWAVSAVTTATYLSVIAGHPLDYAQDQIDQYMRLLEKIGERYARHNLAVWRQFIDNLRGASADPTRLEGDFFSESRELPTARAANMNVPVFFTHLLKLVIRYHLGDYASAYAVSIEAEQLASSLRSHVSIPWLFLYQSLAILQLPDGQREQPELVEKLEQNLRKLTLWAKHAPMNHQHRVDLILGERARAQGDVAAALGFYEAAIAGARENEFLNEEALANELFGRFWDQRGTEVIARLYIREACALYERWGASVIVERLESQYPTWLNIEPLDAHPRGSAGYPGESPADFDLQSILRASQAIASEIELVKVSDTLLNIAMENAGAQRGFLLLEQAGHWVIEVSAEIGQSLPKSMQRIPIADSKLLAEGIVRYVAHTQKTVVLEHAAHADGFTNDLYIQHHQVQSLLCIPLVHRGKTGGILYLENRSVTGAFTSPKVELLRMLAGQMAISLENARMVDQLEASLTARTRDLDDAQTQFQVLFESTPLGVALANVEGRLLAANQALLTMTGYTESDLLQLNAIRLYYEPGQRTEFLRRLEASGSVRDFGLEIVRKDGVSFYASLNASKLSTRGDQNVFLVIIEDVTDKVLTEKALNEANRNLVNLLDSARTMTAALELDDLFSLTFDQLSRMAKYRNAVIWIREGDEFVARACQTAEGVTALFEPCFTLDTLLSVDEMMATRRPITTGDASTLVRLFKEIEAGVEQSEQETIAADVKLLGIPLIAKDQLVGVLGILYNKPGYYTEEMTNLLQAFANQAAIAIDNARLHRQVQEAAIVEERERLARDLHDAVTQTLFSASVIAEATPGIWDNDPALGRQYLEQLPWMLRGALAEMRTLLLELRPSALGNQTLGQLLEPLAESARTRSGAIVALKVVGDRSLPDDVTVALYRIAQESLNNIAKYAEASQISIWLQGDPAGIEMHISDDGRGFQPESIAPGHMGIDIMRERAQQVGATLKIDSGPGRGTLVIVTWSDQL